MNTNIAYRPLHSYLRVATGCPEVAVADPAVNVSRIKNLYMRACRAQAVLLVCPELCVTGYTLGDLVQQRALLDQALHGLIALAAATKNKPAVLVVGSPVMHADTLYNCAAVLSDGVIRGLVAKSNLPNYKEFYEKRWFQPWQGENDEVVIDGQRVPIGTRQLFIVGRALLGIEICEDLWVAEQPSTALAAAGALLIANPSASPEQIGKHTYRRELVLQQSARLRAAYLYAGCDVSESTTDIIMSGHQIIAENGTLLAERPALSRGQELTIADIDLDHLERDRLLDTNTKHAHITPVDCNVSPSQDTVRRPLDRTPFIPKGPQKQGLLQHITDMQAQSLAQRLRSTGVKQLVLGLSGGLDSTLAFLVAVMAAEWLELQPSSVIHTLTMPGSASSRRTQNNASKLAATFDVPNNVIPIAELTRQQLAALGHDGTTEDITYENVQARLRTALLFNRANQLNGLVVGTGDLSEIALGWCTFNGDHMSHYNVNASIPKTLVKDLVAHIASLPAFTPAREIVRSIVDTPISPELTTNQRTEDLVGPYELHDFFLYYHIRWGDTPQKIAWLAQKAFAGRYPEADIKKWLRVFLQRFQTSQWKRSALPDGPKIGSVSLSPRGDWRAPSDAGEALWRNSL